MRLARLPIITNHRPQSFTGPKRKANFPLAVDREIHFL